ncbi:sugar transferase [Chengkuizengella sp. SCS-71B]|uniref:sugar transferase n=1 Tax=Chengkuizengella sp. SCS-71B TaxID=3115290 RepID=UPI0032C24186
MKRCFDIFLSVLALIIFSPVIMTTACLIRIRLGPQVLFKQKRSGLYGKPFYIYKFRSMTNDLDEHGNLLPPEERITKFSIFIRKMSLDEFPQLINVIKGDLSLVGPRPLLMKYLPLYTENQAKRHQVRPGITGWAQVNGRNALSWEEKFKYDVWYVENQSFWLDIKILGLTVLKVFKSEGIQYDDHITMPAFTGTRNDCEDR